MDFIQNLDLLKRILGLILITEIFVLCNANRFDGLHREGCANVAIPQEATQHRLRLVALREEMRVRASLQGQEIDAYIVPIYDEHMNTETVPQDRRLEYLTGFTGTRGLAVITMNRAAFWTDKEYIKQAHSELDCFWKLFQFNDDMPVTDWLVSQLPANARVGADPHLFPHYMWFDWERELYRNFIYLVRINHNLIDLIWGDDRPEPEPRSVHIHEQRYAGEKWESKVNYLREILEEQRYDSMVISSLTEIAYMLNLRGSDYKYTPVFKAYLVVSHKDIILFTNKTRITLQLRLHLKSKPCNNANCVRVRDYMDVWKHLRNYAQLWKRVLIPARCVYDLGASEAVHASLPPDITVDEISPIIFMRAQKNSDEIAGMKMAHIRDGAAMCDAMNYLEERFSFGERRTELEIKREIERSRLSQANATGLSFPTVVAYGPHAAMPNYIPSPATNVEVSDDSTLIIESGGQYYEGTTDVARTFHFGEPTDEMRSAYTNVLAGIIRLSTLKIPEDLPPTEIDTLSRAPIWGSMNDYPHGTGHGIGSYLSVEESPIEISSRSNSSQVYTFKEGYFFSNEPGFYKTGSFGVRLENVFEVVDTGKRHPSGSKFLEFKVVTLVPYELKLIDRTLLSSQEKRWLNEYNAKIRYFVGEELKKQGNMPAFYWMMNKTRHVREYLSEKEYLASRSGTDSIVFCGNTVTTTTISLLFVTLLTTHQILHVL